MEWRSDKAYRGHASGDAGFDLSKINPETPLADIETEYQRSMIRVLIDAEPDKTATFGDVIRRRLNRAFPATPEQTADIIERLVEAGIDGLNLIPEITPDWYTIFVA